MSEENRPEYSSQDGVKASMEISPPPLDAEELAYQQKCFQSLADPNIQRDTIICRSCWSKWYLMIKECPLCRSKTPEDIFDEDSSTETPGECGKISGKVGSPIKVTNKCVTCFADVVEDADEEYEEFLEECGHVHCDRCSKRWFNEIHDCLFCGKRITLFERVEIQSDGVSPPKVTYIGGDYVVNCIECLRRWKPGDSRCPFCSFLLTTPCNANKKDEPSSNVGNVSENQEEVRKEHDDQNPVSKIVMEDACSTFHEIENPVNTSTNQAPTSNIFDSFGNEKQEQVQANEIDPTTSKNEIVIEAPVSDNRGLSASENVLNGTANETYRGLEEANDGHVSKLSEDATIGPEGLLTLGQEGDNEYTCAEN